MIDLVSSFLRPAWLRLCRRPTVEALQDTCRAKNGSICWRTTWRSMRSLWTTCLRFQEEGRLPSDTQKLSVMTEAILGSRASIVRGAESDSNYLWMIQTEINLPRVPRSKIWETSFIGSWIEGFPISSVRRLKGIAMTGCTILLFTCVRNHLD
jgi:hypothetical protein